MVKTYINKQLSYDVKKVMTSVFNYDEFNENESSYRLFYNTDFHVVLMVNNNILYDEYYDNITFLSVNIVEFQWKIYIGYYDNTEFKIKIKSEDKEEVFTDYLNCYYKIEQNVILYKRVGDKVCEICYGAKGVNVLNNFVGNFLSISKGTSNKYYGLIERNEKRYVLEIELNGIYRDIYEINAEKLLFKQDYLFFLDKNMLKYASLNDNNIKMVSNFDGESVLDISEYGEVEIKVATKNGVYILTAGGCGVGDKDFLFPCNDYNMCNINKEEILNQF